MRQIERFASSMSSVAATLLNRPACNHIRRCGRDVGVDTTLAEERNMKALFNRFVREDAGQDLIEYGLLIGLVTTGVIATITSIGGKVKTMYTTLDGLL